MGQAAAAVALYANSGKCRIVLAAVLLCVSPGHLQSTLAIQQQAMNSGAGLGMQTGGTGIGIGMESYL